MTSLVDPRVDRPAVRAKGTVRPSEKPRMMSRKSPSNVLFFLEDDEAESEEVEHCWRGPGPGPTAAVTEELVRQERMLRIEEGRLRRGSYSERGCWSVVVGRGPRSGDVSGDGTMMLFLV